MTSPAPTGPTSGVTAFDLAPLATTAIWDDFNGPYGMKPNPDLWLCDTINQGGIQAYTSDNVYLDGGGHLALKASKAGDNYLSGRITSRTKFNMQYGRVSASIKMPTGTSLFPAFWMLGVNYPNCSEIDLIELVDNATNWYSGIRPKPGGATVTAKGATPDLSTAFHEYWLEWKKDSVTVGIDQTSHATWTPASLPAGSVWDLFNAPMYTIFNLAIGGGWAKPPDATTPFPAQVLIDWFRYTPW